MSLIQEALKRKQDDPPLSGGGQTSGESHERPAHQDSVPRRAAPSPAGMILGVAALILILTLMIFLFWRQTFQQKGREVVAPGAELVERSAAVEPDVMKPPTPLPRVSTPVLEAAPTLPEAPVVEVSPPQEASPAPAPVVSQPAVIAEPVKPSPPAVEEVSWPTLRVMGILTNPESDSDSVIVNEQIRDQGEKIEGVTILRVQAKGVLFRFKGETQFVKVGRSYPE